MGEGWWPYGVEKNRETIEALRRYSFERGLSQRKMTIEELFAPETFDEFRIQPAADRCRRPALPFIPSCSG